MPGRAYTQCLARVDARDDGVGRRLRAERLADALAGPAGAHNYYIVCFGDACHYYCLHDGVRCVSMNSGGQRLVAREICYGELGELCAGEELLEYTGLRSLQRCLVVVLVTRSTAS